MDTLKAEQTGPSKWRVLAIPFGGPFKDGKDLDGEFFSPRTDIKPRWFAERPVLFHHGQDRVVKDADLGTQELDPSPEEDGWWSTVWLDRSARYWDEVNRLLTAGKMYGSSGAVAHLVRKDRATGEILVWPHAEQTLTPTPANPYARITASKAVPDFAAIAADLRPDLFAPGEPAGDLGADGDAVATREALITDLRRTILRADVLRLIQS
jgi:hypothetical protein